MTAKQSSEDGIASLIMGATKNAIAGIQTQLEQDLQHQLTKIVGKELRATEEELHRTAEMLSETRAELKVCKDQLKQQGSTTASILHQATVAQHKSTIAQLQSSVDYWKEQAKQWEAQSQTWQNYFTRSEERSSALMSRIRDLKDSASTQDTQGPRGTQRRDIDAADGIKRRQVEASDVHEHQSSSPQAETARVLRARKRISRFDTPESASNTTEGTRDRVRSKSDTSAAGMQDDNEDEDEEPPRKRSKAVVPTNDASPSSTPIYFGLRKNGLPRKDTYLDTILKERGICKRVATDNRGRYFCPYEGCDMNLGGTQGSRDLARHLESRAHATHSYVCLDTSCFASFTLINSLERHLEGIRFRDHRRAHDRAVKRGLPIRVRNEGMEVYKREVKRKMSAI